ncbi:hypothetical protein BT93_J1428 [Corymbia citriodora subsp. variegata]|nr:hypothetical protein BT93_J1428 [Corymbia citriodora subsp. variegata]
MHGTFSWGSSSEILFSGWPDGRTAMYALALLFVFALCILVEWLSNCRLLLLPAEPGATAGILRSLLNAVRVGLAHLGMLAVMSFDGGAFLVAVAGQAVGFLAFASGAFGKPEEVRHPHGGGGASPADLPPVSC